MSVINYCNSMLFNQSASLLQPIDRLIRYGTRIVYNLPRYSSNVSITTLMRKLKWMPYHLQIRYRLCILTHHAYHHKRPEYLATLIMPLTVRSQRTDNMHRIKSATATTAPPSIRNRAFTFAAPL